MTTRRALEDWIQGSDRRLLPRLVAGALIPAGALYAQAAKLAGRRKAARAERLPRPVVSVGNLAVGGTGKSPCVRWLAERLLAGGHRPLVLGRGYGAPAPSAQARASGEDACDPVLDEEGAALAEALPEVRVVQRAQRAAAGRSALQAEPERDIVLLDDGAQHRALHRDLDLWLLDAAAPFGNGRCLPAGPLREAPAALRRADLVLLTRSEALSSAQLETSRQLVAQHTAPGVPIGSAEHRPEAWRRPDCAEARDPSELRGRRFVLASGIARPEAFQTSVERLGVQVCEHLRAPDHHPWSAADARDLHAALQRHDAEGVLTTEKDCAKLSASFGQARLHTLTVRFSPDAESVAILDAWLAQLLSSDPPS